MISGMTKWTRSASSKASRCGVIRSSLVMFSIQPPHRGLIAFTHSTTSSPVHGLYFGARPAASTPSFRVGSLA